MRAATDDFCVTANAGQYLEADPPLPPPEPVSKDFIPDNNVDESVDFRPTPDQMFKAKGERDLYIGTDGDDVGRTADHQEVGDMLDSGHGFLVRNAPAAPKTVWRVTCEVCDGPLPTPGNDPDWLCQYYDETLPASLTCNCAWCRVYQDYLAGRYKPKGGRPRKRCGSKDCDRKAKTALQAQQRLAKRRKKLAAEAEGGMAEFDALPYDPTVPAATLEDVPEEYREAVRAKLLTKRNNFDGYQPPPWNAKPRGRNVPDFHLSHKRRLQGEAKTL